MAVPHNGSAFWTFQAIARVVRIDIDNTNIIIATNPIFLFIFVYLLVHKILFENHYNIRFGQKPTFFSILYIFNFFRFAFNNKKKWANWPKRWEPPYLLGFFWPKLFLKLAKSPLFFQIGGHILSFCVHTFKK